MTHILHGLLCSSANNVYVLLDDWQLVGRVLYYICATLPCDRAYRYCYDSNVSIYVVASITQQHMCPIYAYQTNGTQHVATVISPGF